ncbi:hypothetical protein GY12_05325 [Micrococcus luteus]|nr:hypothetical protein GY12_05325 [Micrococcus luteus]
MSGCCVNWRNTRYTSRAKLTITRAPAMSVTLVRSASRSRDSPRAEALRRIDSGDFTRVTMCSMGL